MNGGSCLTSDQYHGVTKGCQQVQMKGQGEDLSSKQEYFNLHSKQKYSSRRGNRDRDPGRDGRWHWALGGTRTTAPAQETGRRSSKQPGGGIRRGVSTPTSSGTMGTRGSSRRRSYQTKKKAM